MLFLATFLLVCSASAQLRDKPYFDLDDAENLFKDFITKHGKVYDAEEYLTRLEIFKTSLKEINERNAKHPLTEYGVTRFADLTAEERPGTPLDAELGGPTTRVQYPPEAITAPDQWDWRDHGAVVLQAQDQGKCQSSYIFSAMGNIEGQYAIKYKKLLSLSVQQGVDCVKNPYSSRNNCNSCKIRRIHEVMRHYMGAARQRKYITLEKEYPYTGKIGACQEKQNMTPITNVTSYKVISTDEESLKQLLYETGPLATTLKVDDMTYYKRGIIVPDVCKTGIYSQSVLMVGYGIENGTKYWTCKNSWGPDWGEKGYFRIERGVKACRLGIYYTVTCTIF